MSEAWIWAGIGDLGRGIDRGEIDPLALAQLYLAAAESHEFADRIYARLTPDRALAEAAEAKRRAGAGRRRGVLDGVPVSWKDLFDTAGIATEAGSALLAGRVPEADALVVQRAGEAGLVCLGKTHMSELAFSGLGYNPVTATSPNVFDPALVAGGSSSGAAASVAFGLAAAAIGSDTGGSVRIPASWNDLVGLKTTSGLVPLDGVVPLAPRFDTVGPLARCVEDAALLLSVLCGAPPQFEATGTVAGMRVGVLRTVAFDAIEAPAEAGFDAACARLESAGAVLEPFEAPFVADAVALSGVLYTPEAYGIWEDAIEAQPEAMFAGVRARFRSGKDYLATEYVRAWRRLEALRAQWTALVASYDVVALPTCPIMPPQVAAVAEDPAVFKDRNLMSLRNTRIANLFGLCALSLPTEQQAAGLMLLGAPRGERDLLRIGAAVEAALG